MIPTTRHKMRSGRRGRRHGGLDSSPHVRRRTGTAWVGIAVVAALLPLAAHAGAAALESFFGNYAGEVVVDAAGERSTRDMSLEIKPRKNGFTMAWSTFRRRSDGSVKRKDHSMDFLPAGRPNLYASAVKRNLFGHSVPADPMKGDPFVWASIKDETLTMHALLIDDAGGYEMQTYRRTLTPGGLDLEFESIDETGKKRRVAGLLARVVTASTPDVSERR